MHGTQVRNALVIILLLIMGGTCGYVFLEGYSLGEAST